MRFIAKIAGLFFALMLITALVYCVAFPVMYWLQKWVERKLGI